MKKRIITIMFIIIFLLAMKSTVFAFELMTPTPLPLQTLTPLPLQTPTPISLQTPTPIPLQTTTPLKFYKVSNGYTYIVEGDNATIISYDTSYGIELSIPNQIDGHTVTKIGDSAFEKIGITSVILPDTIVSIGYQAFYHNYISKITIPDSVTSLGKNCFKSNDLITISIGKSIAHITHGAFLNNEIESLVIPSTVTSIGQAAFGSNHLTQLTIPSSVTTIGVGAFTYNDISSLVIGNGVSSIGDYAFKNNEISQVTIPNSVTKIDENAFFENPMQEFKLPIKKGYTTTWQYAGDCIMYGGDAVTDFTFSYELIDTQINKYKVIFDGNGHDEGEVPSEIEADFKSEIVIPYNTSDFSRAGYTFMGWAEDKLNAPIYIENDVLEIADDDIILLAQWEVIDAIGIKISPNEKTISVDEDFQLIAEITPEDALQKDIIWTSDDETIAFVDDNGLVIGMGEGQTTITAETEFGGFKDACRVTVVAVGDIGITSNQDDKTISSNMEDSDDLTELQERSQFKWYILLITIVAILAIAAIVFYVMRNKKRTS